MNRRKILFLNEVPYLLDSIMPSEMSNVKTFDNHKEKENLAQPYL